MAIFGNEIFNSDGIISPAITDYVSRLEKIYNKKKAGDVPKLNDNDTINNKWEITHNESEDTKVFNGNFTNDALNYSDNFELSMKRGINKGNNKSIQISMNDVDGKTILSNYEKVKNKIPQIIDNDPDRNKWETTPEVNNTTQSSIISKFIGNFTGNITDTGKVDKNWYINILNLEAISDRAPKILYNVKENRWWYIANDDNASTYLQSVPIMNTNKPTLFIKNTSIGRNRTEQFPMSQQPHFINTLQQIYDTFDWGPNEYNDSLSPYQITHNEFGIKTNWGTIRNVDSDDRRYEKRVVQKNILLTQGTNLLGGISQMLGNEIPISLNNLDTTGAGIQSTLLFIESTIAGMANGMGMVGSLASNSLLKLFGLPTKASYGMLRPSDSTLHNRYTIDGKGINTGIFSKTPFGVGEIVQDISKGNFGDLPDALGVDLPIFGTFNSVKLETYPLSTNMAGYYSVLSYSQIKTLQVDNEYNNNKWIDFRDYISDGKAYHTQGKKGKPIILNKGVDDIFDRGLSNNIPISKNANDNTISTNTDDFYGNQFDVSGKGKFVKPTIKKSIENKKESINVDANIKKQKGVSSIELLDNTNTIIDYKNFNPETRFGFSKAGAVGMYKKDFTRMQESLEHKMYDAFTYSPIEQVDNPKDIVSYIKLDDNNKYRDYIKFYIYDIVNKELIRLRATVADMQESLSPNWELSEYVGKADPVYNYKNTQRKFSFSFTLYSNTRAEFLSMWRKINKLYGLVYPTYEDDIKFNNDNKVIAGKNYLTGLTDLTYQQMLIISQKYGATLSEINKVASSSAAENKPLDVSTVPGYGDMIKTTIEMKKRNQQENVTSYYMNKGRPIAPFIMLTLGDWFVNEPGYLTELSVQVDNNTPWEINLENDLENVAQLPHLIRISTGFQPIGKQLYENGANFFGWERIGRKIHNYEDPNFVGMVDNIAQLQNDSAPQTEEEIINEPETTEEISDNVSKTKNKKSGTRHKKKKQQPIVKQIKSNNGPTNYTNEANQFQVTHYNVDEISRNINAFNKYPKQNPLGDNTVIRQGH